MAAAWPRVCPDGKDSWRRELLFCCFAFQLFLLPPKQRGQTGVICPTCAISWCVPAPRLCRGIPLDGAKLKRKGGGLGAEVVLQRTPLHTWCC